MGDTTNIVPNSILLGHYDGLMGEMGRKLAECRCGCGVLVPVASRSWYSRGIIKGEPLYAPGHGRRKGYDSVNQTKICTRCPERGPQPLDNFHKKAKSPDGHVFVCKRCRGLESTKQWQNQTEEQRQRVERRQVARVERNRQLILAALTQGCCDCSNKDIRVLEFHHVRGEKRGNISRMMRSASAANLRVELAKCDVICANCHRIRTVAQQGWWKGGEYDR